VAIIGGALQILASIGIALLFGWWRGWSLYTGFFFGSVIALSSTAIVLKYLIDRGELDTHYGRLAIAILIFQDLAVVPLMIFITSLGQTADLMVQQLLMAFLKAALLLGGVVAFSRFILPQFLRQVALSRSREIFFLTAIVICLGTAWISQRLGLSLAIGAFFAGFMFANTEYGYQLIGDIVPFRHVFVNLFFVSIGLLFNVEFALNNFAFIMMVVGLVLLVNFVIMTLLIMGFGYPPRIAMATGIILSQIGEFSFLLLEAGRSAGGIDQFTYQILLSTAFFSMMITPFLFALVPPLLRVSERLPFMGMSPASIKDAAVIFKTSRDHIILCGFGVAGRDLAKSFQEENIPFVLLEMSPQKIHMARKQNIHVIYGDAANLEVMKKAGIEHARAVVVSFADPIGMVQIIRVTQQLNPKVFLAVRTRFEREIPRLYELGADIVVLEEWQASLELNRNLLEHFEIAKERISRHLERIRMRHELVVEEAIMKQKPK